MEVNARKDEKKKKRKVAYLNENNQLDNFIARGSVIDLKGEIIKNLNFEETKFTFFADRSDILIKNFFSKAGPVEIKDGDIKIKLLTDISIETNFKSNLKYDENKGTMRWAGGRNFGILRYDDLLVVDIS